MDETKQISDAAGKCESGQWEAGRSVEGHIKKDNACQELPFCTLQQDTVLVTVQKDADINCALGHCQ